MKRVTLAPHGKELEIRTESPLSDGALVHELDLPMACGGKGLCATCHVFILDGAENLSEKTDRERRALGRISSARDGVSRLACQACVRGNVRVGLPQGRYIERTADLADLVGRRAEADLLHPVDGRVLVEKGKIITKFMLAKLSDADFRPWEAMEQSREGRSRVV